MKPLMDGTAAQGTYSIGAILIHNYRYHTLGNSEVQFFLWKAVYVFNHIGT